MRWFTRRSADPPTPEELLAQGHTAAGFRASLGYGSFRLTVEDVFFITGRGVVVSGRVQGTVRSGTPVSIDRAGLRVGASEVRGIETHEHGIVESASTGDYVGLLLADVTREDVVAGDVITT